MPPKLVDATSSALRSTSACTAVGVFELDGDQPAEPLHLLRGDLMRGIVGQAGIADRPHRRMGPQHHRQRLGVVALPFEPQSRTAEAAQHQPRLERPEDRRLRAGGPVPPRPSDRGGCPRRIPRSDRCGPTALWWRWPPRGRRPSDSGCWPSGVAVVLSTTRVEPLRRQSIASRCRSTTSSPGLAGVSASTTSASDAAAHIVGARRLDDRDPLWRKVFLGIAAHLVVAVGRHHQFHARLGEHPQHRGDRGHPGAERQRRRGSFEFGERRLQLPPGRIRVAPVLVQWLGLVGRQMIRRRGHGRRRHRATRNRFRTNGFDAASGIAVSAVHRPTPASYCARAAAQPPHRPTRPCGRPDARHR